MNTLIYYLLEAVANIHTYILSLNDKWEYNFSDKELHFIVIGLFGLALIFVIHPIFKLLAKNDHIMVISWLYVFTLILMLTFAIEIGQKLTGTGVMEFEDMTAGITGFLVIFCVFALIRFIIKSIIKLIKGTRRRR